MSYANKTASLSISQTELTDAAKYKCEASNKAGRVDTNARLYVQGGYIKHAGTLDL